MSRRVVVVVANQDTRKNKLIDYVGEFHLDLLVQLGTLPVIVPVVEGTLDCLAQYMERMDGLLLVEGDDVEPKRFAARKTNFKYIHKTFPLKDEIEIQLLHEALKREVPILGICRGSQLLNVLNGGTLYGDVQKEKGTHRAHIDFEHYDTYRHPVEVVAGTPLSRGHGDRARTRVAHHRLGYRHRARRTRQFPGPRRQCANSLGGLLRHREPACHDAEFRLLLLALPCPSR